MKKTVRSKSTRASRRPSIWHGGLRPQRWFTLSDEDASIRHKSLLETANVVKRVYEQGLSSALQAASMLNFNGCSMDSMFECVFKLVITTSGLRFDREVQDALIASIAKDLSSSTHGATHEGPQPPVDVLPADVQVFSVEEKLHHDDRHSSRICASVSIVAFCKEDALGIQTRLQAMLIKHQDRWVWLSLKSTFEELFFAVEDMGQGTSLTEVEVSGLPVLEEMATPVVKRACAHADLNLVDPCEDAQQERTVLLVGGRNPCKNDLFKWLAGMNPSDSFLHDQLNSDHKFTIACESTDPLLFRAPKIAHAITKFHAECKALEVAHLDNLIAMIADKVKVGGYQSTMRAAEFIKLVTTVGFGEDALVDGVLTSEEEQFLVKTLALNDDEQLLLCEIEDCLLTLRTQLADTSSEMSGKGGGGGGARGGHAQSSVFGEHEELDIDRLNMQAKKIEEDMKRDQKKVKDKEAEVKARQAAEKLKKKYLAMASAAAEKLNAAQATMKANQEILEAKNANDKAVKKAQSNLITVEKTIAMAKKQLAEANKQHDAVVSAMNAMSEFRALGGGEGKRYESEKQVVDEIHWMLRSGILDSLSSCFKDAQSEEGTRLSIRHCVEAMRKAFEDRGVSIPSYWLGRMLASFDWEGDGFLDKAELLEHFDTSDFASRRRRVASLCGLPCMAMYNGGGRVFMLSPEESKIWRANPQQDATAANQLYEATIVKEFANNKIGVKFSHRRESPAPAQAVQERILYKQFSDFPGEDFFLLQTCRPEEVMLRTVKRGANALMLLTHSELHSKQTELVSMLQRELVKKTLLSGRKENDVLSMQILEALATADREKIVSSMLTFWNVNCRGSSVGGAAGDERRVKEVEERKKMIASLTEGSDEALKSILQTSSQVPLTRFMAGSVCLSFNSLPQHCRPTLVQAPELIAGSQVREDSSMDILQTIRNFFPDPSSSESLEQQIRKKFQEADADRSGTLEKEEVKTLIERTVNRSKERIRPSQLDMFIELIDQDESGTIEMEELVNAVKPRGGDCPYDQGGMMEAMAEKVTTILLLVDPIHTRFNSWEKEVFKRMWSKHRSKCVLATFVTAEHQEAVKTVGGLKEKIAATAQDLAKFVGDEEVEEEVNRNVFGVGSVLDHHGDVSSSHLDRSKWKFLSSGLNKLVIRTMLREEEDARAMVELLAGSLRVVSLWIRKVCESGEVASQRPQTASNQLARAARHVEECSEHVLNNCKVMLSYARLSAVKSVRELFSRIKYFDFSEEVQRLLQVSKKAKKVSSLLLKSLHIDRSSLLLEDGGQDWVSVRKAVEDMEIFTWRSRDFIEEWERSIASDPLVPLETTRRIARPALLGVRSFADLVDMDRFKLQELLQEQEEQEVTLRFPFLFHVNAVRSKFWEVETSLYARNLFLLTRERFLCLDDVKLMHAVLEGYVKVKSHSKSLLLDGLFLLTDGLRPNRSLQIVPVREQTIIQTSVERKHKEVTHFYFSDLEPSEDARASVRCGKIAANTVAAMVVFLRQEILETLGWIPDSSDSDEA
ncbi:hypothetical protein GUITHDRAFT_99859 [Guillardia theta CCMP2712]|uniref:EF-hand domain-containing protein n=1 Tax=Guillardia theta (strain CCMP2712) TaxID=905079 RepID=L1K1A8_GUITC|nr:hypothetical protein GUITHDRAFT_99859 [Guillardia theta CCMP2712]EKX54377.1 hypothetical protein GUITHDRAFT_99859 [Guillardia theta CCMP2712]|eukprot:XP_005841357.1 hypothetical protein GUITHDRAFT_99859 [Guillardia theta CCMP2712]